MQRQAAAAAAMASSPVWLMFFSFVVAACVSVDLGSCVGVNYGMQGSNLPAPEEVVKLLQGTYIDSVKLYASDPAVLSAFVHSDIKLVLGVQNELIPALARSPRAARLWAMQHVRAYVPEAAVVAVAVGNEVLTGRDARLTEALIPAMRNLQQALVYLRIPAKVAVSTPHSMAVLASSSPPSTSAFQPSLMPVMKPLLQFLSETGSPFMVNAYPYFAHAADPAGVPLDYALFAAKGAEVRDSGSGLSYGSLFDAQVDAVYYALKAAGFPDIPVYVSETGWPSGGDANETAATLANARAYNSNLVKRLASGVGTPLKPREPLPPTFIFALFNENQKPGPASERNFGLFQPDAAQVYDAGLMRQPPVTTGGGRPSGSGSPAAGGGNQGSTGVWCVAGPSASEEQLQKNLNFACGEGGADCSAIQPGQPCFNPNTLASHASYAMNSYYQRHGRNYWNCFFDSVGLVTATNPSYGSCIYPSQ